MEFRLYLLQRLTAMIMGPLVIGHIAVMIYAIQGGLTAAEILGRTQGSAFWGAFYGLFVIAVAIHAAIGFRNIAQEWFGFEGKTLDTMTCLVGLGLLVLGGRATYAVVVS